MPEDMTDGETDVEISSHLSDLYEACNLVGYIMPNNKKISISIMVWTKENAKVKCITRSYPLLHLQVGALDKQR